VYFFRKGLRPQHASVASIVMPQTMVSSGTAIWVNRTDAGGCPTRSHGLP